MTASTGVGITLHAGAAGEPALSVPAFAGLVAALAVLAVGVRWFLRRRADRS